MESVTSDPWQEEDSQRSAWRGWFTPSPPLPSHLWSRTFRHKSREPPAAPATPLGLGSCCPSARALGWAPTGLLLQPKQMQTNCRPVTGRSAADCKQTSKQEDQGVLLGMRLTDYPEAGQPRYTASTDAC